VSSTPSDFATAWNLTPARRAEVWREVGVIEAGGIGFTATQWARLCDGLLATMSAWHAQHSDKPGPAADALRRMLPVRMSKPAFDALARRLVEERRIANLGAVYCLPGFEPKLAPKDAQLWKRVRPILEHGHMQPPVVAELATQLKLDRRELERFLVRCVRLGLVYQVAKNRFLLPGAVRALGGIAAELAGAHSTGFPAASFRDRSGIGRNFTIEVLEYFDRVGLTWRSGDTRKLRKPVAQVFGEAQERAS
jgi:selenocysteine-specific elongation factor